MMNEGEKQLNPWLSMWLQPRATIQQIVDSNPARLVLLLAAVAGFEKLLNKMSLKNIADGMSPGQWPWVFPFAMVVGGLGGIVSFYLFAAVLRWSGSWMGGQASQKNIRAALAWSSVPMICGMLLWVPMLMMFGGEMFSSLTPVMEDNPVILVVFGIVYVVVGVWGGIVFLKCLGQVQQFSAWKALGNSVLATLVVLVPVGVIGSVVIYLTS